ncbi:MAG: dockerin type I domain-containing protein [Oscillospiraceae bacterium]|jgi:hypothetical protein|nr:dockerin type I domain-containing protein [Oscillospiraceae bacterium]
METPTKTNTGRRFTALALALLLALTPIVSLPASASGGFAEITVGSDSAVIGTDASVTIPVTLADAPIWSGLSLEFIYDDTALELTNIVAGSELPSGSYNALQPSISVATIFYFANITFNGTILWLTFDILDTASAGDYGIAVHLTYDAGDNFSADDDAPIPVRFTAGTITLTGTQIDHFEAHRDSTEHAYRLGGTYDVAGLEVRAYYTDSTYAVVPATDYTLDHYTIPLEWGAGSHDITISGTFGGESIDKTVSVWVILDANVPDLVGGAYQLSTPEQVVWFAGVLNGAGNYHSNAPDAILLNDINLVGQIGSGYFESIGYYRSGNGSSQYSGEFDGDGHAVTVSVPFFKSLSHATVKNLTVKGTISANGGVAESAVYSTITNCVNEATIDGNIYASGFGGIAGTSSSTVFDGCVNKGAVTGGYDVGGIVGNASSFGTIKNSVNYGTITAKFTETYGDQGGVGGIAGYSGDTIRNSYNLGTVTGSVLSVGGIVGFNRSGKVINSYNRGTVTSTSTRTDVLPAVGGIVGSGRIYGTSIELSNTYNSGTVRFATSDSELIGGIIGNIYADDTTYPVNGSEIFTDNYYLDTAAARDEAGSVAKTAAQMTAANFVELLGAAYKRGATFPILDWQGDETPKTIAEIVKVSDPTRLSYNHGDTFSTAGLVIKAVFSDESEELITDYTVSKTTALTLPDNNTTVTVSGSYLGTPFSFDFTITIAYFTVASQSGLLFPIFSEAVLVSAATDTITLHGDYTLPSMITINGAKKITLKGDTGTETITRGKFDDFMLKVSGAGSTLTLQDITIDGGHLGTVTAPDTATRASFAMISVVTDAVLTVGSGAVLENNYNTAGSQTNAAGGAVFTNGSGTIVKISDGTIRNNYSTTGGAIYIYNGGTLNITSGLITGNRAGGSGGGAIQAYNATLNLTGGTIADNTLAGSAVGSAILQENNGGKLNIGADTDISGTIQLKTANAAHTFVIASTLTNPITYAAHGTGSEGAIVAAAASGYTLTTVDASKFVWGGTGTWYFKLDGGQIKLTAIPQTAPTIVDIVKLADPTKLTYTENETFSTTGLSIVANYSDGTAVSVTNYVLSNTGEFTPSDTSVTVSGTYDGIPYNYVFPITVSARAPLTDGVYQISTQAELLWFANYVNGGHYAANAVLLDDIDLAGTGFAGIGGVTNATAYTGTFDGDGFAVTLALTTSGQTYTGFFRLLYGATVKNLTIKGSVTGTMSYTAGIAAYAVADTLIENCVNEATITGTAGSAGIVGYAGAANYTNVLIKNCENKGTINGTTYTAGIVGNLNGSSVVGTVNRGTVNATSYETGGIAGRVEGVSSIINSANIADISTTGGISSGNSLGGIAGYLSGSAEIIIDGCYNTGTISGTVGVVGGIVGYLNNAAQKITNSYNTGTVTCASTAPDAYVGGIVGRYYPTAAAAQPTIANNFNTGAVSFTVSTSPNIGGVAAKAFAANFENNYYLVGTAASDAAGSGTVTADYLTKLDLVTALGAAFKQGLAHPILTWQPDELAEVVSVAKITDPTKTLYLAGETFDTTGLSIVATYEDETTGDVTDYTISKTTALEYGDTQITVSGTFGGVPYSYVVDITVVVLGDISGDGTVTQDDTIALQALILRGNLTPEEFARADLNHDGKVNLVDVALLKKLLKELGL